MLNELFYITPTLSVPEATAPLEELTIEQRALFNFGTIVIDYFEQMLHMDRRHHLPKGILTTWEPWLDECVQAPHFRWVWGRLQHQYEPALRDLVHARIAKADAMHAQQPPERAK